MLSMPDFGQIVLVVNKVIAVFIMQSDEYVIGKFLEFLQRSRPPLLQVLHVLSAFLHLTSHMRTQELDIDPLLFTSSVCRSL